MNYRSIRRTVILKLLIVIFAVAFPGTSQAEDIVLPNDDRVPIGDSLHQQGSGSVAELGFPINGTSIVGLTRFRGVPLGSFDFSPTAGRVDTGNTDTIIRRLEVATEGSRALIQMIALQLVSETPIDLGAGLDFHYITLQSARGMGEPLGLQSLGRIVINFGPEPGPPTPENPQPVHGTFFYDFADCPGCGVFFDVRRGALDGPIVFSDSLQLRANNTTQWSHFPLPEAFLIPGVNFRLPGGIGSQHNDFFAVGDVLLQDTRGSRLVLGTATAVPEPATMFLLGNGLAAIAVGIRRRHRKQSD